MEWTIKTPDGAGFYWCYQYKYMRMVSVWKYPRADDARLFTNEDGGAPVTDQELYSGALWYGPIEPPPMPHKGEDEK